MKVNARNIKSIKVKSPSDYRFSFRLQEVMFKIARRPTFRNEKFKSCFSHTEARKRREILCIPSTLCFKRNWKERDRVMLWKAHQVVKEDEEKTEFHLTPPRQTHTATYSAFAVPLAELVGWCFQPSQPLGIRSGLSLEPVSYTHLTLPTTVPV